jgi:hypothetical protein
MGARESPQTIMPDSTRWQANQSQVNQSQAPDPVATGMFTTFHDDHLENVPGDGPTDLAVISV